MKVYGAFHPVPDEVDKALLELQPLVMGTEEFFFRVNDMINIVYEGIWFPVDDALEALTRTLPHEAVGKMDVIDLDNWTLTRHQWSGGIFHASQPRDLNFILDYSGH